MTRRILRLVHLCASGLLTAFASAVSASDGGSDQVSLVQARGVMAAALSFAREHNAPGAAIAIVDRGGHLVLLERLDNTFAAAPEISQGKARTAALFNKPTRDFEKIVNEGRTTMVSLSAIVGFTPLQGGVPLRVQGRLVGAVGVSGAASAQQDDEIAQAASDWLSDSEVSLKVLHLPGKQVSGAFKQGAPLHETSQYKVHASRRDGAGDAEIHLVDTDVFYVLDGRATLITGGELVDARETQTGELRGSGIKGGQSRSIGQGDVVVVPQGVPHWFKDVSAPVTYFVVKSSL